MTTTKKSHIVATIAVTYTMLVIYTPSYSCKKNVRIGVEPYYKLGHTRMIHFRAFSGRCFVSLLLEIVTGIQHFFLLLKKSLFTSILQISLTV